MIEVKGLSKTFKNPKKGKGLKGTIKSLFSREFTEIKAVDDVSFNIEQGEIIGYIGANGAGKSTTIKMMTGILVPTSGHVEVDGRVPYKNRAENAQHIGVVFGQKTQLWWDLPLGETFTILKEIYQVSDEDYKERMAYFNEVLSLDDFMDKTVRSLSLGQRMRADLAASMLHNPKVLYLDEPTIGLDVVVKEKIRIAIKEMNRIYKTTIILTTHDMSDIEELCSRLIIIDEGHILYDGDLDTIRDRFGNQRQLLLDIRESASDDRAIEQLHEQMNIKVTDLSISKEANKVSIKFNGALVNLSDVMNYALKEFNVLDFSLKETAIEDIVKKLY